MALRWLMPALAALLAAALLAWGLSARRMTHPPVWQTHLVATWPFGQGPAALGVETALDGQEYGPLGFAVAGTRLAIVDTYQSRLVWETRRGEAPARWSRRSIPDSLLETVVWSGAMRAWLVADNAHLVIWAAAASGVEPWLTIPRRPGTTASLWRVVATPGGPVFVEEVVFGRGTYHLALGSYNARGRLERELTTAGYPTVDAAGPPTILTQVRSFASAPDGELYVELAGTTPQSRTVGVLNRHGSGLRDAVVLRSPVPIINSQLVGLSRQGRIYLAVNVGLPRRPGLILVFTPTGRLLLRIPVPIEAVRAAVYAQVAADGTVYVDESTRTAYRLVAVEPPAAGRRGTGLIALGAPAGVRAPGGPPAPGLRNGPTTP